MSFGASVQVTRSDALVFGASCLVSYLLAVPVLSGMVFGLALGAAALLLAASLIPGRSPNLEHSALVHARWPVPGRNGLR
jgi:hypothetical protein